MCKNFFFQVKSAVSVFNDGGQKLVDYIERFKESDDLDGRDIVMRYAVENIASYTLGLEANTFDNDNSEFRKIALGLFESSTFQTLMFYTAMVFPTLTKYLKIRFVFIHNTLCGCYYFTVGLLHHTPKIVSNPLFRMP